MGRAGLAAAVLLCGCVTDTRSREIAVQYYDIANAWTDLGQFDKAAQYYKQALATDPTLAKASYNLALAYAQLNRPDDAVAILTKLLADDPKNTAVMSTLGWTYHQEGKDEDALKRYDDVLAVSPADQDALYNSAIVLWKLDRKPASMERLQRLLSYTPDAPDALYAAGSLALAMDDPTTSADFLSRYLAKKPEDVDAWYLVAAGTERQQKYSKALDAYDKILTLDSKQAEASFGEARLLLTVVEDPQKGLDELRQALSTGFHDTDAVKALLADSTLLERDSVEAALKDKGLLPSPDTGSGTSPGSNAETPGAGPPGTGTSGNQRTGNQPAPPAALRPARRLRLLPGFFQPVQNGLDLHHRLLRSAGGVYVLPQPLLAVVLDQRLRLLSIDLEAVGDGLQRVVRPRIERTTALVADAFHLGRHVGHVIDGPAGLADLPTGKPFDDQLIPDGEVDHGVQGLESLEGFRLRDGAREPVQDVAGRASAWDRRSRTRLTVSSSGTRSPRPTISFTFLPSSVSRLMASRKMSPVEIWGILYFALTCPARVPFRLRGDPGRSVSSRYTSVTTVTGCGPYLRRIW